MPHVNKHGQTDRENHFQVTTCEQGRKDELRKEVKRDPSLPLFLTKPYLLPAELKFSVWTIFSFEPIAKSNPHATLAWQPVAHPPPACHL